MYYDCMGSVAKKKKMIPGCETQGAWRQEELIGCELPVIK
jgi:hypothetical protein